MKFADFDSFRDYYFQLAFSRKYDEALATVDYGFCRFPDCFLELLQDKWSVLVMGGRIEASLELLEHCLDLGFCFFLHKVTEASRFSGATELQIKRFNDLVDHSFALGGRLNDMRLNDVRYRIFEPEGFSQGTIYPLFVFLHGAGGNINVESILNNSPDPEQIVKKGIIAAYVQSSRIITTSGYNWLNNDFTNIHDNVFEELTSSLFEISAGYPKPPNPVILCGRSGGAQTSIEFTLNSILPVKGFIAISPHKKTNSVTRSVLEKARSAGIKGVVIEPMEYKDAAVQEMITAFDESNLDYRYLTYEKAGFQGYNDDGYGKLSEAIDFLLD